MFWKIWRNNLLMIKYVFRYAPFLIVFEAAVMIVSALTSVINNVYGAKFVLDSVQTGRKAEAVAAFLIFMLLFNLFNICLKAFYLYHLSSVPDNR